jgi:transposase
MAEEKYFEKMFGLPEFRITDFKHNEYDMRVYVEKKDKPSVCPSCGVVDPKVRVHSSRVQKVRDINILNKRVGIMFKRRRYKCMDCQATFYELCDSIPHKGRLTKRLRDYIAEESKKRSFTDLETELDISKVTIREIFIEDLVNTPKYNDLVTPTYIGIDEIHIRREKKHRKQAWGLICNGDKHTVMEFLPDRNKQTTVNYFKSLNSPKRVKIVTMDMWKYYRDAVYEVLPNAKVIVDKFHVQKMANEALDKYRKSLKAKLVKKKNLTLKKDRWTLLTRESKLKPFPDIMRRDAWFSQFPLLKKAYELKEEFFKIYDCQSRREAIMRFEAWKASIPSSLKMFQTIAETVDNWHTEIFNYFDYRYTNAFVEGINSTIRFIEKQGRGYDFEILRAKIIYCINHKIEAPKKPRYASNTFSNVMQIRGNFFDDYDSEPPKDYGVAFEDIIKYFR